MRKIAITTPYLWHGEAIAIRTLLETGGFWRVHIRKPECDATRMEKLLRQIPSQLRERISLHDHHALACAGLAGGIHLNNRNPQAPENFTGTISRSCHTAAEVSAHLPHVDYLFLSPIYDSISKPGYHSRFSLTELHDAGVTGPKVFALGGVTPDKLPQLEAAGFGGAVMLTAAWQDFTQKQMISKTDFRLQFITDSANHLEEVLKGGCRWVQLRMKEVSDAEYMQVAADVAHLCHRYGATFIVDDRVEVVMPCGADGVHLGKNDMPIPQARAILGPGYIIGATANTAADIQSAAADGADYIGLGPFRFTTTKKNLSPVLGANGYSAIIKECRDLAISLPVVAIGGITTDDIGTLAQTGANGVAVSGHILRSTSPQDTTQQLIESLNKWKI